MYTDTSMGVVLCLIYVWKDCLDSCVVPWLGVLRLIPWGGWEQKHGVAKSQLFGYLVAARRRRTNSFPGRLANKKRL